MDSITREPSTDKLSYLRSDLSYLNPPSPIKQVDGPDDTEPPPQGIYCDYCEHQFASCSDFNKHTIQCAEQWVKAQRLRRNKK
jgi:hypothetical protein